MWGERKKMLRLRSRRKADQRSHGNRKRWSKQFKMGPVTGVKDVSNLIHSAPGDIMYFN